MQEHTCRSMLHASSTVLHTDVRLPAVLTTVRTTVTLRLALPPSLRLDSRVRRLCPSSCRTLARDRAVPSQDCPKAETLPFPLHRAHCASSIDAGSISVVLPRRTSCTSTRHGKRERPTIRVVINALMTPQWRHEVNHIVDTESRVVFLKNSRCRCPVHWQRRWIQLSHRLFVGGLFRRSSPGGHCGTGSLQCAADSDSDSEPRRRGRAPLEACDRLKQIVKPIFTCASVS